MNLKKYLEHGKRIVRGGDLRWPLYFVLAILFLVVYSAFFKAPDNYPERTIFTVEEGQTVSEVAVALKEADIIKSQFLFKLLVPVFDGHYGVRSGDYFLNKKQGVVTIARRLANASFYLDPIKLFVPEGLNVFQLADKVSVVFPSIDKEDFIEKAKKHEGYLFPDTYLFLPNSKNQVIINALVDNFDKKVVELDKQIKIFGRPLEDVIKMASILEEEARQLETKRVVAGILWKRLDEGMPLQVDCSFQYVNGKNTFQLTTADLQIDSPYNTYTNKGLPPTPIASPGLDSILAAITPVESDYYFYLTDHDGNMHYAVTHDQHVINKECYLK